MEIGIPLKDKLVYKALRQGWLALLRQKNWKSPGNTQIGKAQFYKDYHLGAAEFFLAGFGINDLIKFPSERRAIIIYCLVTPALRTMDPADYKAFGAEFTELVTEMKTLFKDGQEKDKKSLSRMAQVASIISEGYFGLSLDNAAEKATEIQENRHKAGSAFQEKAEEGGDYIARISQDQQARHHASKPKLNP